MPQVPGTADKSNCCHCLRGHAMRTQILHPHGDRQHTSGDPIRLLFSNYRLCLLHICVVSIPGHLDYFAAEFPRTECKDGVPDLRRSRKQPQLHHMTDRTCSPVQGQACRRTEPKCKAGCWTSERSQLHVTQAQVPQPVHTCCSCPFGLLIKARLNLSGCMWFRMQVLLDACQGAHACWNVGHAWHCSTGGSLIAAARSACWAWQPSDGGARGGGRSSAQPCDSGAAGCWAGGPCWPPSPTALPQPQGAGPVQ